MKICVVGNGILAKEFKDHSFVVASGNLIDLDVNSLSGYDVIINTNELKSNSVTKSVIFSDSLQEYCSANKKRYVLMSSGELYPSINGKSSETVIPNARNPETAGLLICESKCGDRDLIIRYVNLINGSLTSDNSLYGIITNQMPSTIQKSYTWATDLIRGTVALLKKRKHGIYNIVSEGRISESEVCELLGIKNVVPNKGTTVRTVDLDMRKLNRHFISETIDVGMVSAFTELLKGLES